ncbi:hypothetical protein KC19_3G197700 [Ceratodon purpureus]|uniref:Fe2OG dioxygenase domain-containing protein n=1 Tax=Ceratodon purpureus TaxID=3225 RepID=A0A8T0IPA0_CERPU|nr:hypothetical protein KC19_3G197700 [Ceratodon purpureus]
MGLDIPLAHSPNMQSGNSIDTTKLEDLLISVVESGIDQVPPDYIKLPHDRVSRSLNSEGPQEQIPVIDLAMMEDGGPGKRQVLAEIVRACEDWGCFHMINHGVPAAVMDAALDAIKGFFALPAAEREEYRQTKNAGKGCGRSYTGQGVVRDWNNLLILTDFSGEEDRKSDRGSFYDLVLAKPPGAQEALENYGQSVNILIERSFSLVSEALGQTPEFLTRKHTSRFGTVTTHYPPCPQPDLVMGLRPHEDGGIFTLIHLDEVPGLEVLKDERWVPVTPVAHSFVFMIGDLLQIISNDRFKSVTHRVVAGPIARTVMGNFAVTSNDSVIQPAAEFCSDLKPPAFRPVVFLDYKKKLVGTGTHSKRVEAYRLGQ